MRQIVNIPVEQMFDADVIGLPITIEFTLRLAWNSIKPDAYPHTYRFDMSDDPWYNWVLASKENYQTLWSLGLDITDEHYHRFGSRSPVLYKHGSTRQLENLGVLPPIEVPETPMPLTFEQSQEKYREEYKRYDSSTMAHTFTHREAPKWLVS